MNARRLLHKLIHPSQVGIVNFVLSVLCDCLVSTARKEILVWIVILDLKLDNIEQQVVTMSSPMWVYVLVVAL